MGRSAWESISPLHRRASMPPMAFDSRALTSFTCQVTGARDSFAVCGKFYVRDAFGIRKGIGKWMKWIA
jgi:hypothetical protein